MKRLLSLIAAALLASCAGSAHAARVNSQWIFLYPKIDVVDIAGNDDRIPGVSVPGLFRAYQNVSRSSYRGHNVSAFLAAVSGANGRLGRVEKSGSVALTNQSANPFTVHFSMDWRRTYTVLYHEPFDLLPIVGYSKLSYSAINSDAALNFQRQHIYTSLSHPPTEIVRYEGSLSGRMSPVQFTLAPGATTTFSFKASGIAFVPTPIPVPAGGILLGSALLVPLALRARRRRG